MTSKETIYHHYKITELPDSLWRVDSPEGEFRGKFRTFWAACNIIDQMTGTEVVPVATD